MNKITYSKELAHQLKQSEQAYWDWINGGKERAKAKCLKMLLQESKRIKDESVE